MVDIAEKIPGLKNLPKPAKVVVLIGAAGAAAFLIFKYLHKSPAVAAEGGDTPPDDFSGYPGDGVNIGPPITSSPVGQPSVGDSEPSDKPKDDAGWVRDAVGKMYAAGYQDTANVARVLGAYIQGVALEEGEVVIARTAVGLTGRPPSGDHPFILKQTSPTVPTPSQPNQPTTPTRIAVPSTWIQKDGSTAADIQRWYVDRGYPVSWWQIIQANPQIKWSSNTVNARAPKGSSFVIPGV